MKCNQSWAAAGRTLAVVTVALIVTLVLASSAWAVEGKVLYKFQTRPDGAHPEAGLILDTAGNLYGTTAYGGAYDSGTVFKLTPNPDGSWGESVIHTFRKPYGAHPYAGLIFDAAGNLYGTTEEGGAYGLGTMFKLSPNPDGSWSESLIHSFSGADGAYPDAGLIFDAAGNLYSTTGEGGAYGVGTVFKLSPNPDGSWSESVVYNFSGGADGGYPSAGLIFDATGNLYGTTYGGDANWGGTAFKLTPNPDGNWFESTIYTFRGRDGRPAAGLSLDAAGNLYGTTVFGGAYDQGTVFNLTPKPDGTWTRSKLHAFKGPDGAHPYHAGVILDTAGNLYGTTADGGAYDSGTVFKLAPQPDGSWKLTKLHVFKNHQKPFAGLVMNAAGNLYGTAQYGGLGNGEVFQITP